MSKPWGGKHDDPKGIIRSNPLVSGKIRVTNDSMPHGRDVLTVANL